MTVTNTNLRNDYTGNGATTVYAFTFTAIYEVGSAKYSLKVITTDTDGVETLETQGTDYTVSLATNGTGTITFTTAPTSGHKISILPDMSLTQETDYIKSGSDKFPAESHEKALDKLTLIAKQFSELFKRTIKLPNNSLLTEITVPVEAANADKAIVVNGAGDGLEAKDLIDVNLAPVSAFGATLIDDANAAAARTTLGVVIGTDVQAYDAQLASLAALSSVANLEALGNYNTNGLLVQTASNNFAGRTITAGDGVTVTNGNGVANNPAIAINFAVASDQESASSAILAINPSIQQRHPSACKAWVQVTYSGGLPSATTSYNVSSLTDSAGGDGLANFTTAFSSTNYCVTATNNTTANRNVYGAPNSASAMRWVVNGGNDDNIAMQAFGDQ